MKTVDVTKDQVSLAEGEVETLPSVITRWIPEKSHLQNSGVKSDVNLKGILIQKRMERSEIQSESEMPQSLDAMEKDAVFQQEGCADQDEFILALQLGQDKLKCVNAMKKENKLRRVKIMTEKGTLRMCGKKYDLLVAKRFIDSLVIAQLEVEKYGASESLSKSKAGLQIKIIGIEHNSTIVVEQIIDPTWKDRRFICLPPEKDLASLFGSLSVKVEEGDITDDDADVIVNTTDRSFSFSGPLSRAIFSKGGEDLKPQFYLFDNDIGVTDSGKLKCKMILHVAVPALNESMEELVLKILTFANALHMSSITLPTIGAGGSWKCQDVAVGMRRGIAEFAKTDPKPLHLKEVKVVLFSSLSMPEKQPFYDQLTRPRTNQEGQKQNNTENGTSAVQGFLSFLRRLFPASAAGANMASSGGCENSQVAGEGTSETRKTVQGEFAKIIIASDDERSLCDAKKEMEKYVDQRLKEFTIDDKNMSILKQSHIDEMRKIADEQKVRVVVNLENGNHTVTIQGDTDNASHAKEKIQKILYGLSRELPEFWSEMPHGKKVLRVSLDRSSQEYRKVERRFNTKNTGSVKYSVKKIERIQNPTLYRQYQNEREQIAARIPTPGKIDRKLFHGTDAESVNKICDTMFNRSYAGKNATLYGKGVYFSTQSSYSDTYSRPIDSEGTRQMFLARVLTGHFCKGESSMVNPPQHPQTKELCECVVDNVEDPTIFVVFRDWSVYPLYVITYQRVDIKKCY